MILMLLSLGGAMGALARYALGLAVMRRFPHSKVPLAMLAVNVIGSFVLGLLLAWRFPFIVPMPVDDPLLAAAATGFCGAFTTYSTFSMETLELIRNKNYLAATLYVLFSLGGSITAFAIGYILIT